MPRLLLALILILPLAGQVPGFEKNYADGKLAYLQGKFQEAEWAMAAALAELDNGTPDDPHLAGVLFDLGEVYRAQGKYADAQTALERLLKQPNVPEMTKALDALAKVERAQVNYDGAAELYQRSRALQ